MKLILITLVALVVGMMVGCSSTNIEATVEARLAEERRTDVTVEAKPASSGSAPASYVPRYTDAQVIGFIQKHLNATASGSDEKCTDNVPFSHPPYVLENSTVRNTGPQEQYYVTLPYNKSTFTWTFFGGAGQVLPTSINKEWSLEFC